MPDPTGTGPKYSPGMDGDPNGAILENWSTAELESWFREHVESDSQYHSEQYWGGTNHVSKFPEDLHEGLRAINSSQSEIADRFFDHDAAKAFGRLSPEIRDTFFFAWMHNHRSVDPVIDSESISSEWADPAAVGALITLPDGTQITDDMANPDYEPSDSTGPPPSPNDPPQPWWRTPRAMQWVAVGVVTIIVVAGAVIIIGSSEDSPTEATNSAQDTPTTTAVPATESPEDTTAASDAPAGDSQATSQQSATPESTIDSVDDPVGDVSRAFPDLDGVDPDRSVDDYPGQLAIDNADITELTVVSNADGNTTSIAIGFNGNAQGINTEESGTLISRSLGGDVLISPPEGRILNVLFRRDGTIKISDIPSGMSITSEWLTPGQFLIVITGLALNPGTQVEAIVLLEAYGGFMSDVARLITTNQ